MMRKALSSSTTQIFKTYKQFHNFRLDKAGEIFLGGILGTIVSGGAAGFTAGLVNSIPNYREKSEQSYNNPNFLAKDMAFDILQSTGSGIFFGACLGPGVALSIFAPEVAIPAVTGAAYAGMTRGNLAFRNSN